MFFSFFNFFFNLEFWTVVKGKGKGKNLRRDKRVIAASLLRYAGGEGKNLKTFYFFFV